MKRVYVCMLCCGLAAPVLAENSYPFDRIFTTPQERRELDEFRRTGRSATPALAVELEQGPASAKAAEQVRFSGYMVRSDGSQMVWVDGRSQLSTESSRNAGVVQGKIPAVTDGGADAGAQSLRFKSRESEASLKPGQVWMLNEGRVVESYDAPVAAARTRMPPRDQDEAVE
ncbi:MAG: hypothetical protein ABJ308_04540 [Halieaceae bacterium]